MRLVALLAAAAALLSSGGEATLVRREVYLMGTRVTLATWDASRANGIHRLEKLLGTLEARERQLSTWRADSEVSALNAATRMSLSSALCRTLADVARWSRATSGAFDPAIGALTAAWAVHGTGALPSDSEIAEARSNAGWDRLGFDPSSCSVRKRGRVALDVGAFGKGAAIDDARDEVEGPWLIDLGGQVGVAGRPPDADGWTVAIAGPRDRSEPLLEVTLDGGSLATSAGSERDRTVGGRRVGHILDPRTGRPAAFDGSVSVWHERALAADVLSTALYVMGLEEGLRWAADHDVAALFITPDGQRRSSPAFAAKFGPPAGRVSGLRPPGPRARPEQLPFVQIVP